MTNERVVFQKVDLQYDLHTSKITNFKELIINILLRRTYQAADISTVHAISQLDLIFYEGERIGIIGLNGSGKSSLLKLISGIIKPSNGKIIVQGEVQPLIEIGAGFDPEFTGRENIYLNSYMLGFSKKQVKEKEKEIVEFSELNEFVDVPIKYYSSGMIVRLAFSIATSIRPEILLVDEMLSAGDAAFINKAKDRMEQLMSHAKLVVIVSHDLSLIERSCTRVLIMDKGKVYFDGPAKETLSHYKWLIDQKSKKADL